MINRLMWPGLLFVLIGSVVIVDVTMLIVATRDDSFALAEGYDGRARNGTVALEQERQNRRLGWKGEWDVRWLDEDTVELSLRVLDAEGNPVLDAAASARGFHKARAADVLEIPLVDVGNGVYQGTLDVTRLGHWSLRATIVRGAEVFTTSWQPLIDRDLERVEP